MIGFAFAVRRAAEPSPPDGHRAIRTTTPSWALPGIAHQKAASHGFTFPFTPLHAMENNDDFQQPHFKIKTETKLFFFFFFFFGSLSKAVLKARGAVKGHCVSHMVNLFQGIFVISDLTGPLKTPQSLLLRCSEGLALQTVNWAAAHQSPTLSESCQMSRGHF